MQITIFTCLQMQLNSRTLLTDGLLCKLCCALRLDPLEVSARLESFLSASRLEGRIG